VFKYPFTPSTNHPTNLSAISMCTFYYINYTCRCGGRKVTREKVCNKPDHIVVWAKETRWNHHDEPFPCGPCQQLADLERQRPRRRH
jgi:hypothetical protein